MTKITIREFTRKIYEYLKPGEYVVTKNGEDFLRIVVTDCQDNICHDKSKVISGLRRGIENIEKKDAISKVTLPEPQRPSNPEPVYVRCYD